MLQGLSWPYTTVICESKISSEILKCCRSLIYTATFCRTNFWVYLSALLLSKIKIFDYSSILSKNYDNFDSKLLSSQAIPRNGTILADLKRADPNRPKLNRPEPSRPKPNRILYWSWHKISKIVINYTIFSKNYSQLVVKLLGSYTTHRNGIVLFEILRTRRLQQVLSYFWGWPVSWAISDQSCHIFLKILRNNQKS